MPRGGKRPNAGRRKKDQPPAALDGLKPAKAKYVAGVLAGKTKKQAALDAGLTKNQARRPAELVETGDVKEAFRKLLQQKIPAAKIIKRVAEGLDAKQTKFFQHEGRVKSKRDVVAWKERREYLKLAVEYGGYHDPKAPEGAGNGLNPQLQALADALNQEPAKPGEVNS